MVNVSVEEMLICWFSSLVLEKLLFVVGCCVKLNDMSKKKNGVRYNIKTAAQTIKPDNLTKRGYKINPFANGYKDMSVQDFVAKETSENYRRIKW